MSKVRTQVHSQLNDEVFWRLCDLIKDNYQGLANKNLGEVADRIQTMVVPVFIRP